VADLRAATSAEPAPTVVDLSPEDLERERQLKADLADRAGKAAKADHLLDVRGL
jgi:hypothetical protein